MLTTEFLEKLASKLKLIVLASLDVKYFFGEADKSIDAVWTYFEKVGQLVMENEH